MGSFITDLKNSFNKGNIYIQFIYINVGVFIVTSLLGILWMLFNRNGAFVLQYLELPAWTLQFVKQPWSLLTYMFMHAGILHLLFNMLWLYWFGQMFLSLFSAKHFRGLYLLGGICGGLLYMIAYNVFPYFSDSLYYSYLYPESPRCGSGQLHPAGSMAWEGRKIPAALRRRWPQTAAVRRAAPSVHENRVMVLAAGQAVFVQRVEERVGVELLHRVDAGLGPLAGQHHQRTAHRGHTGGVADGLTADLAVALLMVAHIINVVGLVLAVLFAGEDTADVRLALGAGTEAGGVGQQRFQELDGHDLLTVVIDGRGGEHAHILKAAHVVKIALAEGHEEADALDIGQVLAEGLDLLMMQQVHILLADLIKVVLALDTHGRDLDPLAVLHIAAGGGDLAQVDLGVEVGGECIAVIAAVAVEDVDGVDGVELMLSGVGAVGLGHARVKAAAQQCSQAGVLKLFLVRPLPAVVKVSGETGLLAALLVDGTPRGVVGVFRLVVGSVHIVYAAGQAGVHDS